GITSVNHPVFDVTTAEVGAQVRLLRKPAGAPNSAYVVAATRFSPGPITDNGPSGSGVPDGMYVYAAMQIDLAGNISLVNGTTTVTIVTSAPAPGTPTLHPATARA